MFVPARSATWLPPQAGSVAWQPGQEPVYKIKERKAGDVAKDLFIDILKKK